jgi:hypothetical protein
MRIRQGGPEGAMRPFQPGLTQDPIEQIGDAIDHIARALSSIDHNVEVLTNRLSEHTDALKGLHGTLNGILTTLVQRR